MTMDIVRTMKLMKNQKTFTSFVNDRDYVSFIRSGGFYSVTVTYNMKDPSRKKIEFRDSRSWQDIESWLRDRFTFNWQRKHEPREIKS